MRWTLEPISCYPAFCDLHVVFGESLLRLYTIDCESPPLPFAFQSQALPLFNGCRFDNRP